MADAKISALAALAGGSVSSSIDVFPIVQTAITTTKKITLQGVYDAASTLVSVTAGQVTGADIVSFFSTSGSAAKQTTVSNIMLAMGVNSIGAATQAQQETATSLTAFVSPGTQQYHPASPKAWGLITANAVVTTSYPAAGVSAVKNATGTFTVTHGVTFSTANYIVISTGQKGGTFICATESELDRTATVFRVVFFDAAGNLLDPVNFSYCCYGDLV